MKLSTSPFLLALIAGTKLGALLIAPVNMATTAEPNPTVETAQIPVSIEVETIEADRPDERHRQRRSMEDYDANQDYDADQDYDTNQDYDRE